MFFFKCMLFIYTLEVFFEDYFTRLLNMISSFQRQVSMQNCFNFVLNILYI